LRAIAVVDLGAAAARLRVHTLGGAIVATRFDFGVSRLRLAARLSEIDGVVAVHAGDANFTTD
jgi:hypothetical protein